MVGRNEKIGIKGYTGGSRIMAKKELPIISKGLKKSENWKGRLIVIHPKDSEMAKKVNINEAGEYGLR